MKRKFLKALALMSAFSLIGCAPQIDTVQTSAPIEVKTFSAVVEYELGDPPDTIRYTRAPYATLDDCLIGLAQLELNLVTDGGVLIISYCV